MNAEDVAKTVVTAVVAAGVAIVIDRVNKAKNDQERQNLVAAAYHKGRENGYIEGQDSMVRQFGQRADQYAQDFTNR